MRVLLPAVFSVDQKFPKGTVRQLKEPSVPFEGRVTKFTVQSSSGWSISADNGEVLYIFPKSPQSEHVSGFGRVLLGSLTGNEEFADLTKSIWLKHLGKSSSHPSRDARLSWKSAFKYLGEDDVASGELGLRKPQIGALHSIHAHWTASDAVATVVMPTGTGKTETMLATLITARCVRVLVLVPTDALRKQVAEKFLSLGILKHNDCKVLEDSALRPVVGVLTKRPITPDQVNALFESCNVVVTTSALAGQCTHDVRERMAELCTELFIDEAHHAEAPTWKEFKASFKSRGRKVLQFTATPFREDGQPLDGKIIYVYPLRLAQQEGYFRPIRFRPVYAFNLARADSEIAKKVIEEIKSDSTGLHIAMARVSTTTRAAEVMAIYQSLGQFNPVMLHSLMPKDDLERSRAALANRQTRIVVCVDMLGEGFDRTTER